MENNFELYEPLLDSASEAAEACLTTQKLCEAVGVDRTWADCNELEPMEKQVCLNLLAEALMNHVMTAIE